MEQEGNRRSVLPCVWSPVSGYMITWVLLYIFLHLFLCHKLPAVACLSSPFNQNVQNLTVYILRCRLHTENKEVKLMAGQSHKALDTKRRTRDKTRDVSWNECERTGTQSREAERWEETERGRLRAGGKAHEQGKWVQMKSLQRMRCLVMVSYETHHVLQIKKRK